MQTLLNEVKNLLLFKIIQIHVYDKTFLLELKVYYCCKSSAININELY